MKSLILLLEVLIQGKLNPCYVLSFEATAKIV